jgi:hypothetical protein
MKEMFNLLNHKGNENQNSTEIPSHSSQNDSHQENQQVLARMWRKRNPHTLLVGV